MCDKTHPVYFHSERERIFRYDNEGNSEKDMIYRIRCPFAKKNGTQYTITILPHFLLPGCLVRADDVFTAGMNNEIYEDFDKACETMGVLDDRTAKKHLVRFDSCINDVVRTFAGIISEFGERLPEVKPQFGTATDINKNWFAELTSIIISIRENFFGYENLSLHDIAGLSFFFIHPSYPCATLNINSKNIIYSTWLKSPPPDDVKINPQNHVNLLITRRKT